VIPVRVRKQDLGPLTFLAEGGFGKVFRAAAFTLPGDADPLAYKEFTVDRAGQARSAQAAVAFRAGLSPQEHAELDRFTAWPRGLVTEGKDVCGLLMPLIPKEFFCRLADPQTGQMTSKPREMQWLIASQSQRAAAKIDLGPVDRTERLILMAQLVYTVGWLHRRGWVFGDISFLNVVFAVKPLRLMLIDCDGAAALTNRARKQSSTPFWDPPECPIQPPPGQRRQQELQDQVTDTYKLGLAILRCLTPGRGASSDRMVSRLAGELDQEGKDLVACSLSADRRARPAAKDLYLYLRRVLAPVTAPPEVMMARLTTPFRLRGQDVHVEWQLGQAAELTISAGNSLRIEVDPGKHPRGYTFRPDESGPVHIEVRNRFGSASVDLGEVTLYELPPFHVGLNYLPRPQVPALAAFCPAPGVATAARPLLAVGAANMPKVPSLNTLELVGSLAPPGLPAVGLPHVADAVADASAAVTGLILREGEDFASSLRRSLAR
jgi:hypothetical protein